MRVQPFRIDTPQPVLDRITARLADSRIGYQPDDPDAWRYGMDARYLAELVGYWRERYDWRAAEAGLNRWPQFRANVHGVDIHFYHVRSQGTARLPILLTHGWPGSVVEFQAVVPKLLAGRGSRWSSRPCPAMAGQADLRGR